MSEHKIQPTEDNEALSVQRGDYGRNVLPTTLFVLGRLASGPIQYAQIRRHPLTQYLPPKLFPTLSPIPTGGTVKLPFFGSAFAPRFPFIVAAMPTALSIKHAYWQLFLCKERMTLPFALFGVLADLAYESITSLVFTAAGINPAWSERSLYIGSALYFTGIAIELVAELHRNHFKSKPENKGKLCTTGLWSVTRHVNYSANVLFGFGYGLAAGGWLYSLLTAGMYLTNFASNAMPSNEAYCKRKYGAGWERYVEKVPYMLIPGIF